jgi:hypothetical protein
MASSVIKQADHFLHTCCKIAPGVFTPTADLVAANLTWAKRLDAPVSNTKELAAALRSAPYDAISHKRNGVMGWVGIRLTVTNPNREYAKPTPRETKEVSFHVRLTPAQLTELKAESSYTGLGLSGWVLMLSLREARLQQAARASVPITEPDEPDPVTKKERGHHGKPTLVRIR